MSENQSDYTVTGMTCGHCVASVTEEVQEIPGVTDVQVDLAAGVIGTSLVGRHDTSINEARDRCKAAIGNTPFASDKRRWPNTRRVTILLSPTDLPKRGPHFDLAIAVAVLAAAESVSLRRGADTVWIGELGLDGQVRAVRGVLPALVAARRAGIRCAVVALGNVAEAGLVHGLEVLGAATLRPRPHPPVGAAHVVTPRLRRNWPAITIVTGMPISAKRPQFSHQMGRW